MPPYNLLKPHLTLELENPASQWHEKDFFSFAILGFRCGVLQCSIVLRLEHILLGKSHTSFSGLTSYDTRLPAYLYQIPGKQPFFGTI